MSKNLSKLLLLAALIFSAPKRPTNQTNRMSVHAFAHIRRISLDNALLEFFLKCNENMDVNKLKEIEALLREELRKNKIRKEMKEDGIKNQDAGKYSENCKNMSIHPFRNDDQTTTVEHFLQRSYPKKENQ